MDTIQISKQTARRFVMGRQGLWPGRRWRGASGVLAALREMEALQLDPLNVVARSHDIALWGRVLEYQPAQLDSLIYTQRKFFEYGGALYVYPMEEFPYWKLHMQRMGEGDWRWPKFAAENPELIEQVRRRIRSEGPLGNRDIKEESTIRGNYRGRKRSSLALYYLWLTGELMVHHRRGFDRVYDFRQNVLPPEYDRDIGPKEIEAFFARKAAAFYGLIDALTWKNVLAGFLAQKISREEGQVLIQAYVNDGLLSQVKIEGSKKDWFVLSEDVPFLETLESGAVPAVWKPAGKNTRDEVVFLAPLEIVSARGRARGLFDFDYVWEVYKPAAERRWGYYTLPVLYGDRLVGRIDPKLERSSSTLIVRGFWLEEHALISDEGFVTALRSGLRSFGSFIGAEQIDISEVKQDKLRKILKV